jgi:hypothetical protein
MIKKAFVYGLSALTLLSTYSCGNSGFGKKDLLKVVDSVYLDKKIDENSYTYIVKETTKSKQKQTELYIKKRNGIKITLYDYGSNKTIDKIVLKDKEKLFEYALGSTVGDSVISFKQKTFPQTLRAIERYRIARGIDYLRD